MGRGGGYTGVPLPCCPGALFTTTCNPLNMLSRSSNQGPSVWLMAMPHSDANYDTCPHWVHNVCTMCLDCPLYRPRGILRTRPVHSPPGARARFAAVRSAAFSSRQAGPAGPPGAPTDCCPRTCSSCSGSGRTLRSARRAMRSRRSGWEPSSSTAPPPALASGDSSPSGVLMPSPSASIWAQNA